MVIKGGFASANMSAEGKGLVIWDSGASKWMTPAKMSEMTPVCNRRVTIADGSQVNIEGLGVKSFNYGGVERMVPDVLVVPKFVDELVSVSHVLKGTKDAMVFTANAAYMVVAPKSATYIVGTQISRSIPYGTQPRSTNFPGYRFRTQLQVLVKIRKFFKEEIRSQQNIQN